MVKLSRKTQLGIGVVGAYCSYTGYVYVRSQMEIERRQQMYRSMAGEDLLDKAQLVDPRFRSMRVLGRFENPFPEYRPQTLFEFFAMRLIELSQIGKRRGGLPSTEEKIRESLPVYEPDFDLLQMTHEGIDKIKQRPLIPRLKDRLTYTWLGQSCALVQVSSLSFLLDPLFDDHLVSEYVGPKRYTPCPTSIDRIEQTIGLPDFVLVSHDHPDHLDLSSIDRIGNGSRWIVPTGLGPFLKERGVTNVVELDWWDRVPLNAAGNYEIVCLPAMHWGGRTMVDANQRLWCSFMIVKDGQSVLYHGGDTGYSSGLFRKLGQEFGPVKLAALPIGQYCPQWHQRPRHISPQESVQIMKDLSCAKMVGVHWGTFVLSSENYLEPAKQLSQLATLEKRPNGIIVPEHGRTMVMDMSKMVEAKDGSRGCDGQSYVYK